MPKLRANGVEISYEVQGTGTPLLFIHGGFGGPQSTLAPQARIVNTILAKDPVQVVTYDRRGAGQSEHVTSEYKLPNIAAALHDRVLRMATPG